MIITVFQERENSTKRIAFAGTTILELLQKLKLNPETMIVVRKNEVLTEHDHLHPHDRIELLSVVSGG